MNPFEGKTIRSRLDRATNRRWYSIVDVCAAILGCDYQKARSYWKWLKAKSQKPENETTSITFQLKFEAADGKMRRTEVMDALGVLGLISSWPSGRGEHARHWLAKIETEYENAVELVSETIPNAECKAGNLLYKVVRTVIYDCRINGEPGSYKTGAELRGACGNDCPDKPPRNNAVMPKSEMIYRDRATSCRPHQINPENVPDHENKSTGINSNIYCGVACVYASAYLSRHEAAFSKIGCMGRCA